MCFIFVFTFYFFSLNHEGAKDAKGFFVGIVLILGEKFRINTEPSPDGH